MVNTNHKTTGCQRCVFSHRQILLSYDSCLPSLEGIKSSVLLELGFADTFPNRPTTISSWALDAAFKLDLPVRDNRATEVLCYLPTYTFVEKLQAITKKYNQLKSNESFPKNFLRHYYDIYCLLGLEEVRQFIKTKEYQDLKIKRFRGGAELAMADNPAFLISNSDERLFLSKEYRKMAGLYYRPQPSFDAILERIQSHLHEL
jgi:hypothetical protein